MTRLTWIVACSLFAVTWDHALADPSARVTGGDEISDAKQRYQFTLKAGWRAVDVPDGSRTPLIGYTNGKAGASLVVNRVTYPNIPAWRRTTRAGYYDDIERGVTERVKRYKRLHRGEMRKGTVPVFDLTFRYRDKRGDQVVLMRFVFYRRYSLSLVIRLPARKFRRYKKAMNRVRDSFQPYVSRRSR